MSTSPAVAHVAGLDYDSPAVEFNVRPQPGTVPNEIAFKARKGTQNLVILDVQPDNQGTKAPDGQVYQWFKLQFPDGQTGWLRSHILTIQGDCTRFGYGVVQTATYAYLLRRVAAAAAPAPAAPAPSAPAPAPAPVSSPAPAPAPVQPPAPAPEPDADQVCVGTVSAPAGARLRQSPVTGMQLLIMPFGASAKVLEVRSISGEILRWVRVDYQGTEGWTREDLLRYSGGCGRFNLTVSATQPAEIKPPATFTDYVSGELYPVPMRRYRFVRGFQGPVPQHNGVDYGGDTGEPMLAGPVGGLCVASVECVRCNVPGKPSTLSQGLGLANPAVFSDPAWNFGYGHYVIIRYLHNQLPSTTQQALANMGLPGAHVYAMYAHLNRRDVNTGDTVAPGQMIGTCGDTGNSQGPHLHLELRASRSPNFTSWAALGSGLFDPLLMFRR